MTTIGWITFAAIVLGAALWWQRAGLAWMECLNRRGILTELAPGGLLDRAQDDIAANFELVRRGLGLSAHGLRLLFTPDRAGDVERLRLLTLRRLAIVLGAFVAGLQLPIAAAVVEWWAGAAFQASGTGVSSSLPR